MEPVQLLSAGVAAYLGPLLPYLVSGGGKAVEEVGRKLGEGVWQGAVSLWTKLRNQWRQHPEISHTLEALESNPSADNVQERLRGSIVKLLASDDEFASTIAQQLIHCVGATAGITVQNLTTGDDSAVSIGRKAVSASTGGFAAGEDMTVKVDR